MISRMKLDEGGTAFVSAGALAGAALGLGLDSLISAWRPSNSILADFRGRQITRQGGKAKAKLGGRVASGVVSQCEVELPCTAFSIGNEWASRVASNAKSYRWVPAVLGRTISEKLLFPILKFLEEKSDETISPFRSPDIPAFLADVCTKLSQDRGLWRVFSHEHHHPGPKL